MFSRYATVACAIALVCIAARQANTQAVPTSITYQGKLTDTKGQPVKDGLHTVQFRLFDAQTGGSQLWDSGAMSATTTGGVFTVALGTAPSPAILSSTLTTDNIWLEVQVGADSPLPRVKLSSAPFALRSADLSLPFSKSLSSVSELFSVTNTGTGRAAYFRGDNTSSLTATVKIDSNSQAGALWCNATGFGVGLYGTSSTASHAIWGVNSGTGTAGSFAISNATNSSRALEAQTSGTGNAGNFSVTNSASAAAGVYGTTSGTGAGVEGYVTGSGRAGYFEVNNAASNKPAVDATTNGTSYALHSINTTSGNYASLAGSNYAVYAWSVASNAIGMYSTVTADYARSIYGVSTGAQSYAVYGYTSGAGAYGLYGYASGTNGSGLYARGASGGYSAVLRGNVQIQDRVTGNTAVELGTGLDYAEGFDVSSDRPVQPGAVLVIDSRNPGKLAVSKRAYDRTVAGIVAGARGLGSGVRLGTGAFGHNVALAGRVYCNVDATEAAVRPGDLLTTSARPGFAMKVTDHRRAQGATLGKAMEGLARGKTGQILVLVTLQ